MASTIAAVTTSGGGVVTTADASGNLNLLAGTTTVVAVTTAGAAVTGTLSATGVATFAAGTVALPSITTSGDTNTGIYFPAADTIAFTEAGTERMRIDSSGNVGIGTTSPVNILSVNGGVSLLPYYQTYLANSYYSGSWKYAGNGPAWGIGNNFGGPANGATIAIAAVNAGGAGAALTWNPAFNIDSSGNVGIGTSSPTSLLHVSSTTANPQIKITDLSIAGGRGGSIQGSYSGNGLYLDSLAAAGWVYIGSSTGGGQATNIRFDTSNAERMRIDSSGNLLVGTTSQVSQGKGNIAFNGSSHQGLNLQETANQSSAGFMYFQYNTTVLGTITRNVLTNAVQYNTTSDIRLKENIENANSALTTISNIKVRQYDWIGCEDSHQDYGFIAQELVEVVSGIVTKGRTEEDIWAVDYGKLTPILCKAIQEQQALITALTARIEALENK